MEITGIERSGARRLPFVAGMLAALVLLAASVAGRAQAGGAVATEGKARCDPPSQADVAHAKSCAAAVARWRKCPILDSSLVEGEYSSIITAKCEKTFLSKLSGDAKKRYEDEKELCSYRYARQLGTMWGGRAGECDIDVAAQFAAHPAMPPQPARAASFDCDQAKTRLERIICSDKRLGRADVVLARVTAETLKNFRSSEKPDLIRNQREWRKELPRECRVTSAAPTPESLLCLREAFEMRFTDLEHCTDKECLPSSMDMADEDDLVFELLAFDPEQKPRFGGDSGKPLASFDCEKASTPLETVICDDAKIGARDIQIAQAYQVAGNAMAEQQQDLAGSQQRWWRFVEGKCLAGNAPGDVELLYTHVCVRKAFETRASQLQACPKKAPQQRVTCLNEFRVEPK